MDLHQVSHYIKNLEIDESSNMLYYNIDKLADKDKIENIRTIFILPDHIYLPKRLAYLIYSIAIDYDTLNIMNYINFFKNRDINFCWHHLQYKYY